MLLKPIVCLFIVVLAGCATAKPKMDMAMLHSMADAGDPTAMFSLGVNYESGRVVPVDRAQAVKWYLKAAEAGFAEAQVSIGAMYISGQGVERDPGKAVEWFKAAAEQGHPAAMHNLASAYETGESVPRDITKAAALLERAAEKGFYHSMFKLGMMHARGEGVPVNKVEAYKWLSLARLHTLNSKNLDAVWNIQVQQDALKKMMSPADITTAETAAMEWAQAHRKN